MDLIPSRLMNVTLESYLLKISTRSKIIYWIIILIIAGTLVLLPFINVDVTIRTKGYFHEATGKHTDINQNLIATCYVDPSDIRMVAPDQKVKIQIDALDHKEWGFLDASIIGISSEMIIKDGSSGYFLVECRPETCLLKHKNGVTAILKSGMNFSARIIITQRSLFNLLFDKADNWYNAGKVNSEKEL